MIRGATVLAVIGLGSLVAAAPASAQLSAPPPPITSYAGDPGAAGNPAVPPVTTRGRTTIPPVRSLSGGSARIRTS